MIALIIIIVCSVISAGCITIATLLVLNDIYKTFKDYFDNE